MRIRRTAVAGLVAGLLVASACGASDDSTEDSDGSETTGSTVATGPSEGAFGDLTELCGDGDFSVDADQQGLDNGKLNIGVATDRASDFRPGLNKEVWDASAAFADWCNEQGGIGGLEINLIELSAALLNVEAAMSTACTDVFAMVGGGLAQDNLQFSGNAGSDFHQCEMIDLPAFTASGEKSGSNGLVQAYPNTPDTELNTVYRVHQELHPEQAGSAVIVYGELPTMQTVRDKYEAALTDVGIEVVGTVSYPMTGVTDWVPYARAVMDTGAQTLTYVGEPEVLASLLASLREQGWDGIPVLNSNTYDDQLFGAGNEGPEGALIRMPAHPFEEADQWPATEQYLDLVTARVPDARTSLLGVQSWSSWLLFTTAANRCAAEHDGVLDRTCILEQAATEEEWDGAGLHAPQMLGPNDEVRVSPCSAVLVVRNGEFERLYPEIGGTDDEDGDGFHCPENGVTEVDDGGVGQVDPSRPI